MTQFLSGLVLVFVLLQPQSARSYCDISSDCTDQGDGPWECCNNECFQGTNCLGSDCVFQTDCSAYESCCNRKCVARSESCLGEPCRTYMDCYGGEECCLGTCHEDCNHVLYSIIGCVAGVVLLVLCVIILVVRLRQRRLRRRRQPLLVTRPTMYSGPPINPEPPAPVVFTGQAPYQNFAAANTAPNLGQSAQPPPYKQ